MKAGVGKINAASGDVEMERGWVDPETWQDRDDREALVGSLPHNQFGLHEMLGNVVELCRGSYAWYPGGAGTNGLHAPPDGELVGGDSERVMVRGGGWTDKAKEVTPAVRKPLLKNTAQEIVGVRPSYVLRLP